jgi:hypothetical protein
VSEHDWTAAPVPPANPDVEHAAVVDGLKVKVKERPAADAVSWTVEGFLANLRIYSYSADNSLGHGASLDDAKAEAIAAAHRLYAAGVRGEKSYPVSCCDRTLPTKADAERHERDHLADIASSLPRQDVAPTLRFYADDTTVLDRNTGQVIEEHETVEDAEAHVARLAELDTRRIANEQARRAEAESEGGASGEEERL